jgi:hypothetical protein
MALPIVTVLAARHAVFLGGFAPANDRHQMIHCQRRTWEFLLAVMTDAGPHLLTPPLSASKFARLGFFFALMIIRSRNEIITHAPLLSQTKHQRQIPRNKQRRKNERSKNSRFRPKTRDFERYFHEIAAIGFKKASLKPAESRVFCT